MQKDSGELFKIDWPQIGSIKRRLTLAAAFLECMLRAEAP